MAYKDLLERLPAMGVVKIEGESPSVLKEGVRGLLSSKSRQFLILFTSLDAGGLLEANLALSQAVSDDCDYLAGHCDDHMILSEFVGNYDQYYIDYLVNGFFIIIKKGSEE